MTHQSSFHQSPWKMKVHPHSAIQVFLVHFLQPEMTLFDHSFQLQNYMNPGEKSEMIPFGHSCQLQNFLIPEAVSLDQPQEPDLSPFYYQSQLQNNLAPVVIHQNIPQRHSSDSLLESPGVLRGHSEEEHCQLETPALDHKFQLQNLLLLSVIAHPPQSELHHLVISILESFNSSNGDGPPPDFSSVVLIQKAATPLPEQDPHGNGSSIPEWAGFRLLIRGSAVLLLLLSKSVDGEALEISRESSPEACKECSVSFSARDEDFEGYSPL
ncbi:uncharacterized protein G2W53_005643 [Senna tora]|uniref:Uncharacterized protein n=1 Tax=Senna tora TaxID=362788 RepID=A0A835CBF4_9FABA|nr:uncharacterized protein G2W53_005643 [Senna tora]